MSAQFTPGKWSAINWVCHAPTTIVSDHDGQRIVIAECSGHGRYAHESIADARVMAEAKEMFSELQSLITHMLGHGHTHEVAGAQALIARIQGVST